MGPLLRVLAADRDEAVADKEPMPCAIDDRKRVHSKIGRCRVTRRRRLLRRRKRLGDWIGIEERVERPLCL
jgi:hypothetical protein